MALSQARCLRKRFPAVLGRYIQARFASEGKFLALCFALQFMDLYAIIRDRGSGGGGWWP